MEQYGKHILNIFSHNYVTTGVYVPLVLLLHPFFFILFNKEIVVIRHFDKKSMANIMSSERVKPSDASVLSSPK